MMLWMNIEGNSNGCGQRVDFGNDSCLGLIFQAAVVIVLMKILIMITMIIMIKFAAMKIIVTMMVFLMMTLMVKMFMS